MKRIKRKKGEKKKKENEYASEMNEHNRNNLGITRTSARDYMHF